MRLSQIPDNFDLIVIGGGITGAGILAEATRLGISTLLCEQSDFAWGTSSRSSKLVHGGLRYLKEGRIHLTYESVRHRQRLMNEAPGLVTPVEFLMPIWKETGPGRLITSTGLTIYDLMAGKSSHKYLPAADFLSLAPGLKPNGLSGGFLFKDAQTDDARLVLRLIFEAKDRGGIALNYTRVEELLRNKNRRIRGVALCDRITGETREIKTRAVINATGSWAEELHPSPDPKRHLRPLRGSHLVFPSWRLPVFSAVTMIHPEDKRPLFIFPWEGALLFGTTDIDHTEDLLHEPSITREEALYMIACIRHYYPAADIRLEDAIASYAGVRPVLSEGDKPPSQESREHVVWKENGLVTITGGKLTTFRVLAADALNAAARFIDLPGRVRLTQPAYNPVPEPPASGSKVCAYLWNRLFGRYGMKAKSIIEDSRPEDLEEIPGTCTVWAELKHAAQNEDVCNLSDLLLRRVRIGILAKNGGAEYLGRIKEICAPVMDWSDERWTKEINEYNKLIMKAYRVPEP